MAALVVAVVVVFVYLGAVCIWPAARVLRTPAADSGAVPLSPPVAELTFQQLRAANLARQPAWGHECQHWQPAHWLQAVVGELGEYANWRKKLDRGDLLLEPYTPKAAEELADVMIYLDLLAHANGIDLEAAVRAKFNQKSRELKCSVLL